MKVSATRSSTFGNSYAFSPTSPSGSSISSSSLWSFALIMIVSKTSSSPGFGISRVFCTWLLFSSIIICSPTSTSSCAPGKTVSTLASFSLILSLSASCFVSGLSMAASTTAAPRGFVTPSTTASLIRLPTPFTISLPTVANATASLALFEFSAAFVVSVRVEVTATRPSATSLATETASVASEVVFTWETSFAPSSTKFLVAIAKSLILNSILGVVVGFTSWKSEALERDKGCSSEKDELSSSFRGECSSPRVANQNEDVKCETPEPEARLLLRPSAGSWLRLEAFLLSFTATTDKSRDDGGGCNDGVDDELSPSLTEESCSSNVANQNGDGKSELWSSEE